MNTINKNRTSRIKKPALFIFLIFILYIAFTTFSNITNKKSLNNKYLSISSAKYPNEKQANEALLKNSKDEKALRTLADIALEKHDRAKSEQLYRRCLLISPNNFITKYMFGLSLIGTKNHKEGIGLLEDVANNGDDYYKSQSKFMLSKFK